MGSAQIRKELAGMEKEKLLALVMEMYKNDKGTKAYLDFFVTPDVDGLYKRCHDKILHAFYPKRGYTLRLMEGKKALSEFKKYSDNSELLVDLMLWYAECGVKYTLDYGDIYMSFYDSVSGVFAKALELAKKEGFHLALEPRAKKIVAKTNGIGWGFHDDLEAAYYKVYRV